MIATLDALALQATVTPDACAARCLMTGAGWTYAEFDHAASQFAAGLSRRGVGRGDRVASLSKNRPELILLHFACARVGAMYVPLNWRLAAVEIAALVEDAEPALIVGDAMLAKAKLAGLPIDEWTASMRSEEPMRPASIDIDAPSLILYTSGTSGKPKGALLSERNIECSAANFVRFGKVTAQTVVLCDSPMFHIIGLITNIRPALMNGGCVIVSDGFIAQRTLARLGDPTWGITHYFCVPQMAALLRAESSFDPVRLRGLTAIFSGGAPHATEAIRAWCADGVPLADGFGMSETGTVSCMPLDIAQIEAKAGSAGLIAAGLGAMIRDDQGLECAAGEAGELWLKGANVTSGYWRRPNATAEAFDEEGWFRTGDIARIDSDGYLWMIDRKKDMFISGGENVYPAEIEAALAAHPRVKECAVIGIDDQRWGEVGHLAVVTVEDLDLDVAEMVSYLEARLARYKIPKKITVINELPRNGAGKVLKAALRSLLE